MTKIKLLLASFFHSPNLVRLSIFLFVFISSILIFSAITIKAHSESDVSFRQESILLGAGLSASSQNREHDINPAPIGIYETHENTVISMSYEVDEVTPTPTPVIIAPTDDIWTKIAQCESKQNWSIDTGNGYYGGLQFSQGAWNSVGGTGKPSDASKDEQIMRGRMLQERRGWGVWGLCAKKLGLT